MGQPDPPELQVQLVRQALPVPQGLLVRQALLALLVLWEPPGQQEPLVLQAVLVPPAQQAHQGQQARLALRGLLVPPD